MNTYFLLSSPLGKIFSLVFFASLQNLWKVSQVLRRFKKIVFACFFKDCLPEYEPISFQFLSLICSKGPEKKGTKQITNTPCKAARSVLNVVVILHYSRILSFRYTCLLVLGVSWGFFKTRMSVLMRCLRLYTLYVFFYKLYMYMYAEKKSTLIYVMEKRRIS